MEKLRSHIIKVWITGFICSGLMLAFTQPAEANKTSRDFAHWLQSMAKQAHSSDVEQQLAALKKSRADVYQLIEQASEIVTRNNQDFNFSFDPASAAKDLHQVLLVEWNHFQADNAMTGIPSVQQTLKLVGSSPLSKTGTGNVHLFSPPAKSYVLLSLGVNLDKHIPVFYYATTPMTGGIAIGAP